VPPHSDYETTSFVIAEERQDIPDKRRNFMAAGDGAGVEIHRQEDVDGDQVAEPPRRAEQGIVSSDEAPRAVG
jgi:hypothetical protein